MKLDKAIEILGDIPGLADRYTDDELEEAERLGIEALKRTMSNRITNFPLDYSPLPGETEE